MSAVYVRSILTQFINALINRLHHIQSPSVSMVAILGSVLIRRYYFYTLYESRFSVLIPSIKIGINTKY